MNKAKGGERERGERFMGHLRKALKKRDCGFRQERKGYRESKKETQPR